MRAAMPLSLQCPRALRTELNRELCAVLHKSNVDQVKANCARATLEAMAHGVVCVVVKTADGWFMVTFNLKSCLQSQLNQG